MPNTPNACCTMFDDRLVALRDQLFLSREHERSLSLDIDLRDLLILEHYAQAGEMTAEAFNDRLTGPGPEKIRSAIERSPQGRELLESPDLRVFLGGKRVVATAGALDPLRSVNLSVLSNQAPRVAFALFEGRAAEDTAASTPITEEELLFRTTRLTLEGLLVPDAGRVRWGDLKRRFPFCSAFGHLRGTPIDRYYLYRFLLRFRNRIRGRTLEVGGKRENAKIYGFGNATEYRTLELPEYADDLAGDAGNPDSVEANSFESIVAFHVLEHCEDPRVVVDNVYRWLKPGGLAMVAVPASQKVHHFPHDFWRPQPDGLESMFSRFSHVEVYIYGNLVSVIAGLCGMSAEEVGSKELDEPHPDYPMLGCAIARK